MSFSDLGNTGVPDLTRQELDNAKQSVNEWLIQNAVGESNRLVVPDLVFHDRGDISEHAIMVALAAIASDGQLNRVFVVRAPTNRQVLRQSYNSLRDIPEQLADSLSNSFNRSDADVLPAYEVAL